MNTKISMLLQIIACADVNDRFDIADFAQKELESLMSSHGDLQRMIDFSTRKDMYYEIVDFAREYKESEIENFALKQLGKMRKEAKSKSTKIFIW